MWAIAFLAAVAWAGPSQDRGWLSLAWDAHEAGLFEEALSYLGEIGPDSELGAEAVWLRAECLYDLGRFQEAARVLEGPGAEAVEDREAFLRDVYWDWVWAELTAGRYEGAVAVAERMARVLPDDPYAEVLLGAARFRRDRPSPEARRRFRFGGWPREMPPPGRTGSGPTPGIPWPPGSRRSPGTSGSRTTAWRRQGMGTWRGSGSLPLRSFGP
ncbi:MAG: tetratricopeptide repeat protein [Deltaproteobacteria bacterium]|nr:tetratricopeptide repeat protein [Deltaproteobacteria bacterium]